MTTTLVLFLIAAWFVAGGLFFRYQAKCDKQNRQLARYRTVFRQEKISAKPDWLAFMSRLETLIGKQNLLRYQWYVLGGSLLFLAGLIQNGMKASLAIGLVILGVVAGVYFLIKHLELKAIETFNHQMPDIIDAMIRAVKVGAPLHDIFLVLSHQHKGVPQRLFSVMHDRLILGHSVDKVMKFAYKQVPSQEFRFLTILLSLQHETGGKLTHMLTQLGNTLRERHLMEGRVRTITSESRTSAKVLAMLPLALIGVLYGSAKEHFDYLLTDDTGQWVLFYVIGSVALGLALIRQLTKVKF